MTVNDLKAEFSHWKSLRGQAATSNDRTVRVRIDRAACFHVESLRAMMACICLGGLP